MTLLPKLLTNAHNRKLMSRITIIHRQTLIINLKKVTIRTNKGIQLNKTCMTSWLMVQMGNKWENNNPIKTPETAKDQT